MTGTPVTPFVDPFDSLIAESVSQTLTPDADTETPETPTDTEAEKDSPKDAEETPEAPTAKEEATPDADATEDEPKLPEGMVAVPSITKPATEFKVMDAEGEIEAPALIVEFNANGKIRKEPLDKVVKLAQWGVYNHERHQAAEAALAQANEAKQSVQQMQAQMEEYETAVEELLQSDEAYLKAREEYERRNTPEARMAAREAKLAEEQERVAFSEAANKGQQFMEQRIGPALELLAKHFPTITEEELAARVLLEANQHTVRTKFGSVVHPDAHMAIANFIANDVFKWAEQAHDARLSERQQAEATTKQEVAKARAETQKAKNLVAKAVKPTGKAAPESKPKPNLTKVDDIYDDVIRQTLQSVGSLG